jgi:hypothetical protein
MQLVHTAAPLAMLQTQVLHAAILLSLTHRCQSAGQQRTGATAFPRLLDAAAVGPQPAALGHWPWLSIRDLRAAH